MAHDINFLKSYLIKLGTPDVAHTNGDFMSHLSGVYRCLEQWGCAEHVMLAGLFHSIYGTQAFQNFSLPTSRREEIKDLIGEQAERLAYIYCAMTYKSMRESVLEGKAQLWDRLADRPIEMTEQEFTDLLWVKLADILEQEARLKDEEKSLKYAGFWRQVAERLGEVAVNAWKQVYDSCEGQLNYSTHTAHAN
jgi:(p)ppGpp synthase/HD superfamily hydrolase